MGHLVSDDFAASRRFGRTYPFAGLQRAAGFAGPDLAADLFRRVGDQLAGHCRCHRRHADFDRAVSQLGKPDVIVDIIEKVVGQIASTY